MNAIRTSIKIDGGIINEGRKCPRRKREREVTTIEVNVIRIRKREKNLARITARKRKTRTRIIRKRKTL